MSPAALQHRLVCAQIRDRGESWPTAYVLDGWLFVEAGETVQIDIWQGSPSAGQILRESARVADGQWHERDEQWRDAACAAERALETAYALLAWAESGLVEEDYS